MGFLEVIYITKQIRISEWKTMAVCKSLAGVRDVATKKEHVGILAIDARTNVHVFFLILKLITGSVTLFKNIRTCD